MDPKKWDWQRILHAAAVESLRNRLMVALAYDGALRRKELVPLAVEDFEPAHRLIHLRAETTKSRRSREVSFGTATSELFVAYLGQRRQLVGRTGGRLLRSVCVIPNRSGTLPAPTSQAAIGSGRSAVI